MPSILLICTANQFRSPIAAACLMKALAEQQTETWVVESAGTWTAEGLRVPGFTLKAAARLGLAGLEGHITRHVSRPLLESFDLLIVMENGHKEALASEFPSIEERLYLLSEVATGARYDIPDPAAPGADVDEIARELDMLVKKGKDRIMHLARRLHR